MPDDKEGPTLSLPVSDERDHIQGSDTASVTLVEYGDYECPHCYKAYFILKELASRLPHEMRLVFRNFPLAQMHPHAAKAAEAAEAAGAQGQFWEMHDMLFEHQDALEDRDIISYAADIGIDVNRFEIELAQSGYRDRIREDFLSGVRSGVNGTPTFFVNERRLDGPWDIDSLTEAIKSVDRHGFDGGGSASQPHARSDRRARRRSP